jgi:hypothetical protein
LVILGGLLVAVGSFLPWVTATAPFIGSISRSGMDGGDGVITLVLGAAAAVLGLMFAGGLRLSKGGPILIILCAVAAGVVAGLDYSDVQGRVQVAEAASSLVSASVGAGLWSIFVGAVMTGIGGAGLGLRTAKPSN